MPDPSTGRERAFTRATTFAKALKDSTSGNYALEAYRDRMLLKGLLKAPELLEGFDTSLLDTVREQDLKPLFAEVAENASTAGGGADKREFGTAVHAWTEALDHGKCTFTDVPEMFKPYVAVYATALADAGVEIVPVFVERIVYCPATDTVGTLDRLYRLNGELIIGDLKTSSNIRFSWPSISAQLAQYADASTMWSEDGTHWEEMPPVNKQYALIAELPALPEDRDIYCDLHLINLEIGRKANDLAAQVRAVNRRAGETIPLQCCTFGRTSAEAISLMEQSPAPAPVAASPAVAQHSTSVSDDELGEAEIRAALEDIFVATTIDELNGLFRPSWTTPSGAVLMDEARRRAEAIQNDAALRSSAM